MDLLENALQYEDYCTLRTSAGWDNFSREQAIHALEHSLYNVTAVEDGRAIAMGRLIGDGLYYTVADVVVHPQYQGRGIGSKIIKKLLLYADQQTPPGGRASVQLISVKGKEPFYEKLGFRQIPNDTCGPGMKMTIQKEG